jgi:hypothetical protein
MHQVTRFLVVMLLAVALVSLVGRTCSDFDEPAENDPHDLIRGIGIWVVAVLIAGLVELRIRNQKSRAHLKDKMN